MCITTKLLKVSLIINARYNRTLLFSCRTCQAKIHILAVDTHQSNYINVIAIPNTPNFFSVHNKQVKNKSFQWLASDLHNRDEFTSYLCHIKRLNDKCLHIKQNLAATSRNFADFHNGTCKIVNFMIIESVHMHHETLSCIIVDCYYLPIAIVMVIARRTKHLEGSRQ